MSEFKEQQYDEEQVRLMQEKCILVDMEDKVLGSVSKKDSHLAENIKKGMLHRAFSVFLFNSKGELLLQQRSAEKITFPSRWTNTCCSHPLYRKEELIEEGAMGVKNAAIRKMEHELGIKVGTIKPDELVYLTRIYYQALSDDKWGEHEIDWILFVQKDVEFEANKNEVSETKWVTPKQLKRLLDTYEDQGLFISPWFHMIAQNFFFSWWENLEKILKDGGLDEKTANTIHPLVLDCQKKDEKEKESEQKKQ